MTFSGDPYRTLGLMPGATLDEIKRAYRRLAKQYHPDSAGPAAVRRFLVIQGAYEALLRSRGDAGHGRGPATGTRGGAADGGPRRPAAGQPNPGSGSSRGNSPNGGPAAAGRDAAGAAGFGAHRPWDADSERARSTRERYRAQGWARARTEPGPAGAWSAGRTGADAAGPHGRGDSREGDSREGDSRGGTPRDGDSRTGAPHGRPDERDAGAQDRDRDRDPAASEGSAGSAGGRPRHGWRRARPGSTSYDGVEADGRAPAWDGATWYGAASGTYWTINPKEYADPRKHGPDYLQRGRRDGGPAVTSGESAPNGARAGSAPDGTRAGSAPDDAAPFTGDPRTSSRAQAESDPGGPWSGGRFRGGDARRSGSAGPTRHADAGDRGSGASASSAEGAGRRRTPGDRRWMGVNPPDGRRKAADPGDGRARPAASRPGDDSSHAGARWFDPAPDRRGSAAEPGWAGAEAAGPPSTALATPGLAAISGALARHRRVILAALAWPPIGFVVIALVGEATGCARFSASCADPTGPANTILQIAIQVVIVSAFLAAPAIARPAAAGTLAMLLAAAPASVVLVSFGGARAQGESQELLIGLLAIAYGIGLAAAVGWPDRLPEPFGRRTMGG